MHHPIQKLIFINEIGRKTPDHSQIQISRNMMIATGIKKEP
ncbi:hypothetical protein F903_01591 [Acinetobacter sp. NIPH 298]|nr:hypothetical protein F903_01591 [Acinetobacter sp. NIPH 298]